LIWGSALVKETALIWGSALVKETALIWGSKERRGRCHSHCGRRLIL
jgi:hypothetical protein